MVGDEEFDLLDEAIINEGDDDFQGSEGSDAQDGSSIDDGQFVVLDDVEQDDGEMLEIDEEGPEEVISDYFTPSIGCPYSGGK
jgi:hypothetical protein